MTQTIPGTINPNTKSGTALATDLNNWQATLHSMHLGSSQPSYAAEGLIWADNTSADLIYKAVDAGTTDVPLFQIDATNHVARVALDNDGDSYLHAATDDKIRAVLGGTDVLDLIGTGIQTLLTYFDFFDANGNTNLRLAKVASAVNYPELLSAATGNGVEVAAKGSDTNIDLLLKAKGTGVIEAHADHVPDTDSTHDLGSASKAWLAAYADKVVTDELEDATTGATRGVDELIDGAAKAHLDWSGGAATLTVDASFNIGSSTDHGTGNYEFAFTANMGSVNYAKQVTADNGGGFLGSYDEANSSASSIRVRTYNGAGSPSNSSNGGVTVHGDLA